jgi:hypothetical protein
MATPIAAPNLQRFVLPEIEISCDSNGIISVIDDLVERVMSAHYRRAQQLSLADEDFAERELVA